MKYECHITIEPVYDEELTEIKRIAELFEFKVADLIMKKYAASEEVPSKKDTFMTGHSDDFFELEKRMINLIVAAREKFYKILRYKIERIVTDSRVYDHLKIL